MNRKDAISVLVCIGFGLGLGAMATGCAAPLPPYGTERALSLTGKGQIWAVAPAINLSGQSAVDPLIQADVVFAQLQTVRGLTVIPVNRVADVYASLQIERVSSPEQATIVCDLLGCDALVIPTITAYDPYDPPKIGAALQVISKSGSFARPANVDPRELARSAAPKIDDSQPPVTTDNFIQSVGMFDAADGSVRQAVLDYAAGRHDPVGPMGPKEYFANMDRYCGFVYYTLIEDVLKKLPKSR
jgi:hypothetical protein